LSRGAAAENADTLKETSRHAWRIYCLDKSSGRILWERTAYAGVPKVGRHPKSSQASATPATDGKHLVAYFGSEGLYCYDFDGRLLWKKDLGIVDAGSFLFPDMQYNTGSSPILYKNMVIVLCDRQQDSFVAAYDIDTGKQIWLTRHDEVPSWGTPLVYEGKARTELITNSSHIRAYDPLTGAELWRLSPNSKTPVPTPVAARELIYVASGYPPAYPIYSIRAGASGNISLKDGAESSEFIAWSKKYGGPSITTPLVYGDYFYTCSNNGVLAVYAARTGERLYQQRLGSGAGFTASPVAADGRLYLASEDGDIYVVRAGPKFELLATNRIGEVIMATPAISKQMIILRGRSHVYGIGRPNRQSAESRGLKE
ncbi:MAG: PQQ-binding-like beta-propeller repeat protein, partial [Gammaproteobacteria bacterium]